eukprot:g16105.t1
MSKAAGKDRNMSHTGDTSLPHCAEHQITEVLLTTRPLLSPNRFLQGKLQNVHEASLGRWINVLMILPQVCFSSRMPAVANHRKLRSLSLTKTSNRNSSLKINNYNNLSPSRHGFQRLPGPFEPRPVIASDFHRVHHPIVPLRRQAQSRGFRPLFSRSRSRSLTQLRRQITPPTKNGHAPPPIESRKIFNLSILTMSGPGKFSRVESN